MKIDTPPHSCLVTRYTAPLPVPFLFLFVLLIYPSPFADWVLDGGRITASGKSRGSHHCGAHLMHLVLELSEDVSGLNRS